MHANKAVTFWTEIGFNDLKDTEYNYLYNNLAMRFASRWTNPGAMNWQRNYNMNYPDVESVIKTLFQYNQEKVRLYIEHKPQELAVYDYFKKKFNKDYEENSELFDIWNYRRNSFTYMQTVEYIREKSKFNWMMLLNAEFLSVMDLFRDVPFIVLYDLDFMIGPTTSMWWEQKKFYLRYRKAVINSLIHDLSFEDEFRNPNNDGTDNDPFKMRIFRIDGITDFSNHWKVLESIFVKQKLLYDYLMHCPKEILEEKCNKYPDLNIYLRTTDNKKIGNIPSSDKSKAVFAFSWINLILIDLLNIDESTIASFARPHNLRVKNSRIQDQSIEVSI